MDTIAIEIDAELANNYIRNYREFCPGAETGSFDDLALLQAFVHDRLREEAEFIAEENE